MDVTQPMVTQEGKPARQLLHLIESLRTHPTDPHLSVNARVVDENGKPTRALSTLLVKLTGKTINANVAVIDPETGYPTKPFYALVNP